MGVVCTCSPLPASSCWTSASGRPTRSADTTVTGAGVSAVDDGDDGDGGGEDPPGPPARAPPPAAPAGRVAAPGPGERPHESGDHGEGDGHPGEEPNQGPPRQHRGR